MNLNDTIQCGWASARTPIPGPLASLGTGPRVRLTALDLLDKAAQLGVQRRADLRQPAAGPPVGYAIGANCRRRPRQRGIVIEVGTRGILPNHLQR